jgi:hypothetical protein
VIEPSQEKGVHGLPLIIVITANIQWVFVVKIKCIFADTRWYFFALVIKRKCILTETKCLQDELTSRMVPQINRLFLPKFLESQ